MASEKYIRYIRGATDIWRRTANGITVFLIKTGTCFGSLLIFDYFGQQSGQVKRRKIMTYKKPELFDASSLEV